jgi:hypothetical protein
MGVKGPDGSLQAYYLPNPLGCALALGFIGDIVCEVEKRKW